MCGGGGGGGASDILSPSLSPTICHQCLLLVLDIFVILRARMFFRMINTGRERGGGGVITPD